MKRFHPTRHRTLLLVSGLLAWLVLAPETAWAVSTLYSVSPRDNLLRALDPVNGATLSTVPIALPGETVKGATGLATDPVTGLLYGLLKTSQFNTDAGSVLVIVDPLTGFATSIGDTGDAFAGLAFDSTGRLFAVTGDGASIPETLFTLSLTDASPALFLTLGNGGGGEAIAFLPSDGLLYHGSGDFDPANRVFESVDLSSLAVTNIPLTRNGLPTTIPTEIQALTYESGETLLLTDPDGGGTLYSVTSAGAVTFRGRLDHESKGLAFGESSTLIPEPASVVLFGTGLAGLAAWRRRGQRAGGR